jgi:hypothetical protein
MNSNELTSLKNKVIETRLNAYGPLYVKKPLKYLSNLDESFINARNAIR